MAEGVAGQGLKQGGGMRMVLWGRLGCIEVKWAAGGVAVSVGRGFNNEPNGHIF